jgi:hypothetical protein
MFTAPFFGGLFFVCLGVYLFIRTVEARRLIVESESWPTIPAKISLSKATKPDATSGRWNYHTTYEYEIEGKCYKNNIATFYTIIHEKEAKEMESDFPEGENVCVYYDPQNPKKSVLKLGRGHTSKNSEVISSLLFTVIGLAVMAGGYFGVFNS